VKRAAILLALVACGGNRSTKDGVTVELASVTLANDCGSWGAPPPPPEVMAQREDKSELVAAKRAANQDIARESAGAAASEAACPPGETCGSSFRRRSGCQQTSMQLYFRAASPTSVKIKTVELLDAQGKWVQDLAPRAPTYWNDSAYVGWDEHIVGGNKQVSASYALTTPNWDKLGGRVLAQTKTYHLRVVVAVGDADHTLEKMSITPTVIQVMPEPDVVTMR
jgi:hypothetical protein